MRHYYLMNKKIIRAAASGGKLSANDNLSAMTSARVGAL
jgi:hypothetical protein